MNTTTEKNNLFLIFFQKIAVVFLIWICHHYNNECTLDKSVITEHPPEYIHLLSIRLLAKNDSKNKVNIMKSNVDISDNEYHDELKLKANSHINNQDKSIYGKMSSNTTTENRKKNISYDDTTDNKLKNLEKQKTQKKGICCLCNTFKNIDSYYAKKILIALGITVEKTKNRNMYVYNEEKMSYIKILSLFLPYIILISIGLLMVFVDEIKDSFPYFFGLSLLMIFYILIKAIKYVMIQKKNKKKIINN